MPGGKRGHGRVRRIRGRRPLVNDGAKKVLKGEPLLAVLGEHEQSWLVTGQVEN